MPSKTWHWTPDAVMLSGIMAHRILALLYPVFLLGLTWAAEAAETPPQTISLSTATLTVEFQVGADGRLYQRTLGAPPAATKPNRSDEAYPQAGDGYIWEPALEIVHHDGNTSTDLRFVGEERQQEAPGREVVRLRLQDPAYPLTVVLAFRLHAQRDVVEQWVEITHQEPGPIRLGRMASSALRLPAGTFLTHFRGDWAKEMGESITERLTPGMKVLDSKLVARAHQFRNPNVLLSLDGAPTEDTGRVLAGCLAWSGNFQFAFDGDAGGVRALAGINPFASTYVLAANETFTTPTMIWGWSTHGLGDMSRKLHAWARDFGLRDGHAPRTVLLNNWEATGFDFNHQRIAGLFPDAKAIGTELFLLDDGWFGDRHARTGDHAGLGDWMPNPHRFPQGLAPLAEEAKRQGLQFGIWLEPEMVNPQSDLFECHPDWAIRQPQRTLELQRQQLVLDLTRPEVQAFAWNTIQGVLAVPGIAYAKWDCNRYVTQPGSPYLAPDRQSNLTIDYVRSLYALMAKTAATFPTTELMLCSGGGGRVDYGALRYFHEFWPSDNTDAKTRVTMQWDYSYFFPSLALASHVTHWGKRPLHFATAVAMSTRFGMDLDLVKLSPEDKAVLGGAISAYQRLRPIIHQGDLYRLERPHGAVRGALNYVDAERSQAVVFVFQLQDGEAKPVRPQGLDPARRYTVTEVNPAPGRAPLARQGATLTGADLMRDGLVPTCAKALEACVIALAPVTPSP